MKTITLNSKHWFHRWVLKDSRFSEIDICSYTRLVLSRLLLLLLMTIIYGFPTILFLVLIGVWGRDTISLVFNTTLSFPYNLEFIIYFISGLVSFLLMLITLGSPFIISVYFYTLCKNMEKTGDREPNFVSLAYRSWKDKYCVKIKFK